jgi:hypothetical protein
MISVDSWGAAAAARPPKRRAVISNSANRWKNLTIIKIDVTPVVQDA